MSTCSFSRSSFFAALACFTLASSPSIAAELGSVQVDTCEQAVITPDAPGGDTGSATFLCAIVGGGGNIAGLATVTAGQDYFSNVASPILINGTAQMTEPATTTLTIVSKPTWGPGVTEAWTKLSLKGTASGSAGSYIIFHSEGMLGGPALVLDGTYSFNGLGLNTQYVDLEIVGQQVVSNTATLTATATIFGAVSFFAPESEVFEGSAAPIPEPSRAVLVGVGLGVVLLAMQLNNRRRTTVSSSN